MTFSVGLLGFESRVISKFLERQLFGVKFFADVRGQQRIVDHRMTGNKNLAYCEQLPKYI